MLKDWWTRLQTATGSGPLNERRDVFHSALADAREREEEFLPLFEQLAFALRIAESPVPIDRATIPLNLSLGPDKVKELAAQIKLSPYLKSNIQALVHHFREDQRDLKNAERAGEMLAANPQLQVRNEAVQLLFNLFHFLPASREQFRDYPLFYQLFGGEDAAYGAALAAIPEELQFFLTDAGAAQNEHGAFGQFEPNWDDLKEPAAVLRCLEVPPLTLEVGLDVIPLIDPALGGELMELIAPMRLAIAQELGFVMPGIQFRDNLTARSNSYALKVRGNVVGTGEIMLGYQLATETPETEASETPLVGFTTRDPILGRPAVWVTRSEGKRAAKLGYLVQDATRVLISHLDEVVRAHAHEILSLEEVSVLLDSMRETALQTIEAVIPDKLELADYQLILKNLLRERVSIRDQRTILERLAHAARPVHPFYLADRFGEGKASIESIMLMEISAQIRPLNDPLILTEMVRMALSRQICAQLADDTDTLDVVLLDRQVEQVILDGLQTNTTGQTLTLAPATRDVIVNRLTEECQCLERPVILCDPRIRPFVKQLTTRALPRLTVISHAELHPQFRVQSVGTVSLVQS